MSISHQTAHITKYSTVFDPNSGMLKAENDMMITFRLKANGIFPLLPYDDVSRFSLL